MEVSSPQEVVKIILSTTLRVRTGLWVLPCNLLGQECNEAARLMVDAVDIKEILLTNLPAGSRFLGLTEQKLIELLDEVSELEGQSTCALIYNIDLLLSHLNPQEIKNFWQNVIEFVPHRSRALLLTMPASAIELLPSEDQKNILVKENRYTNTENHVWRG